MGYKSCINRYGGKFYMKDEIIALFPDDYKFYVEGFGGAAHILFRKEPSIAEVYNDKDEDLYNFFKVIQDDDLRERLIFQLQLTPYSRYEFEQSKIVFPEDDLIERARKFYVRTMMSVNSIGESFSISRNSRGGMGQKANQFINHVDKNMDLCGERLKGVIIENLDILELIDKYDCKDTFFYFDPPYIANTRVNADVYKYEMTNKQHIKMVDRLLEIEGKVLISGYDNEIYEKLLQAGWTKQILGEYKKRSSSNGSKGIEIIWKNY